jgi:hypothetical protein
VFIKVILILRGVKNMLLQNISRYAENPIRVSGYTYADVVTKIGFDLSNHMNKYIGDGDGLDKFNGVSCGYTQHYTWGGPITGGGLASRVSAEGEITEALLAVGRGLEALVTSEGTVNTAILQMIVGLLAIIEGSGDINYADLRGSVALLATISGEGIVSDADLGAIVNLVSHVYGVGSVDADLYGQAHMSAHVYVNEGSADIDQLAEGVWNAIAAEYELPDTMGARILDVLRKAKLAAYKL